MALFYNHDNDCNDNSNNDNNDNDNNDNDNNNDDNNVRRGGSGVQGCVV